MNQATNTAAVEDGTDGVALGIASGKGGVGKTTTALNLGAALVESGYTVAIADLDLGMANLGAMVGLRQPKATIHDVLAGRAELEKALHEAGGLTILPGSTVLDDFSEANTGHIQSAIDRLRDRFDVVLLDVGAGLNHEVAVSLEAADGVLLVTSGELPALTDASKTGELVERLDVPVVGAVFAGTGSGEFDDIESIATALGTTGSITVGVPADKHVTKSVRKGMPVVFETPEAPASVAYKRLAASLESALEFRPDEPAAETDFEWIDPDTGADIDDEPGPVMEVPLETLIEEAGLETDPSSTQTGKKVLDRVRTWLGD